MTFNNWHLTLELRKGGALALVWVQTLEKAFSNNQLTPLQLETPKTRMMIEEEKNKKDNNTCSFLAPSGALIAIPTYY